MRWFVRILLTLVTLAIVAVAALFLVPKDRIARIAEAQFEENTGRRLSIRGDVSPTLFPRPGVALGDVTIANADWAGGDPMLKADTLDVGVGLSALMGGEVVVETFSIDGPVIRLERAADGAANWDFVSELGGEDDGGESSITSVSLPKGTVTNGKLVFVDRQAGETYELDDLDVDLSVANLKGLANVDLSARMRGQAFALSAQVNGLQQLLDGGQQAVEASVSTAGNKLNFKGLAGLEPVQAKGAMTARIDDQKALFALLGQEAPRIPEGLGQQVGLDGNLTLTEDAVFLRGARLQLDQNALQGDIDLTLSETPKLVARLSGDRLDFSAMSTDTSEGDGAANAGAGGWSDARLDVSGLSAVNGEFSFKANAVDLGSVQLGATDLKGSLDRSRLVLNFNNLAVFDGGVSGQFVVNNRNGLSIGGDMTASGVAMQKLLDDFAGFDRLVADGSMRLKFLGVGSTMNEIMNSLSGDGRMDVGSGELLGLDIAGMIKNLDASYQGAGSKTVFDGVSASFAIQDGVLRNDDLAFDAKFLTATGQGQLDLGGQTIDYRVIPVALADQIDTGIRVPVLITGPWNNIKFRPDLKGLIDTALEEEKAELKAAAKAKEAELKAAAKAKEAELKAKAAEKLGVTPEDGQSAEDALKQGLEDKAKDALKGLFGGN